MIGISWRREQGPADPLLRRMLEVGEPPATIAPAAAVTAAQRKVTDAETLC